MGGAWSAGWRAGGPDCPRGLRCVLLPPLRAADAAPPAALPPRLPHLTAAPHRSCILHPSTTTQVRPQWCAGEAGGRGAHSGHHCGCERPLQAPARQVGAVPAVAAGPGAALAGRRLRLLLLLPPPLPAAAAASRCCWRWRRCCMLTADGHVPPGFARYLGPAGTKSSSGTSGGSMLAWWPCSRPTPSSGVPARRCCSV